MAGSIYSEAKKSLFISSRGGKGGRNAVITEKGDELVMLFNHFNKKFPRLLQQEAGAFIF